MTAVYTPLQNASPAQRGAVTTAAQEIAGLKKFLDGLESAQLAVVNDYDAEPVTIDGDPFTANGMPFSLGGPTEAAAPFWGLRAQMIDSGGEAGILEQLALGRFKGNGPIDLIGPDYTGQAVLPGLTFSLNAFITQAALLAGEVALGLNDAGDAPAVRIDEGRAFIDVPLHLDHADAEFHTATLPFRFNDDFNQLKLRMPSNGDIPGGFELWGPSAGDYPLSLNRDDKQSYSLRAVLPDATLGSPLGSVHAFTVDLSVLDEYLAAFGTHDGLGFDNFASAFRISSKGAIEIVEKHDAGPLSDWDIGGDHAEVDTSNTASGVIDEPSTGAFLQITINTSECKANSLPRVLTVGAVVDSKARQITPHVYSVSNGSFVVRFYAEASATAWLASASGGQLRWEISR